MLHAFDLVPASFTERLTSHISATWISKHLWNRYKRARIIINHINWNQDTLGDHTRFLTLTGVHEYEDYNARVKNKERTRNTVHDTEVLIGRYIVVLFNLR